MLIFSQVRNNLRVVLPSQQNRGGPEEAVVVSIFKYEPSLTFMSWFEYINMQYYALLCMNKLFFFCRMGYKRLTMAPTRRRPFR